MMEMTRAQVRKYGAMAWNTKAAAFALMLAPFAAHAEIDVAGAVTAIGAVAVALLLLYAAFIAVSTGVLGISRVASFLKKKAGG